MVAVLPNPARAARDLGFLSVAASSPQVVAPLIAGVLTSTLGFAAVFVTAMCAALAAAGCIFGIKCVR